MQNCCVAVFADLDGGYAIAMVTGELLENALKHGDWSQSTRAQLRLEVEGASGKIAVSVQNPITEADPHAANLLETIEWIAGFPTAEAAYRARMLQIAAEDLGESAPSRLGLVRIAFEGNCKLSAQVAHGTVTVTATLDMSVTA